MHGECGSVGVDGTLYKKSDFLELTKRAKQDKVGVIGVTIDSITA